MKRPLCERLSVEPRGTLTHASLTTSRLTTSMALTSPSRCADDVCRRVHAMEPALPITPPFLTQYQNPCFVPDGTSKTVCLPAVHIISGWHMLDESALGFLKAHPLLESRGGGCFDDWGDDTGGGRWAIGWGGPPKGEARLILTHCNKLLGWYPAFAGRYTSAWGKAYGPCKENEMKTPSGPEDYYAVRMWRTCRPQALAAHDKALGNGGVGFEATPPFVMRTLYGSHAKVISAVRNPVDRLETSFWQHTHYPRRYGASSAGLHKYVAEQTSEFAHCAEAHSARRCAYMFELIDRRYGDVFFHCDQIIRGLYEPFVRDWHAALGKSGLLVLTVESLVDSPSESQAKLLTFLGLPTRPSTPQNVATRSYAQLHAATLAVAKAEPMSAATRALADAFYRPYNEALAQLLGDPALGWPMRAAA